MIWHAWWGRVGGRVGGVYLAPVLRMTPAPPPTLPAGLPCCRQQRPVSLLGHHTAFSNAIPFFPLALRPPPGLQIFDVLAAATYLAQALEPTIAIIVFITVGSYIPLTVGVEVICESRPPATDSGRHDTCAYCRVVIGALPTSMCSARVQPSMELIAGKAAKSLPARIAMALPCWV